jgi:Ca-activated chloride channel family protein
MQRDKLERSFQALEAVLRSLRPADRFNLLLFNTGTTPFAPAPVAADTDAVERALAFVRAGRLRGGTDLQRALDAAVEQSQLGAGDRYVVVLGDASPTQGTIANARIASWYAARRAALPAAQRPRTYLFGVGDDVNTPLLKMLSRDDGLMDTLRSTEPAAFKIGAFVSKIGARPLDKLQLTVEPAARVDLVYALDPVPFAGSLASWVGRYAQPSEASQQTTFIARGVRNGQPLEMRAAAALPAESLEHAGLPRAWAKARVDALLDKIARDGEDRASVDEIIQLARQFKFVTPYTSFLAAPRALLRPRVIKPGDPVLRVATDESITSVVALFPFGLVKPLRYLPGERIWQTRFLAPADMTDGTYDVRLIMHDEAGHAYRETKSFVIASKPPALRVTLDKARARPGDTLQLRASASASTRTIVARLYGAAPVDLRWDAALRANAGLLTIPDGLPAGRYVIRVTAEDIAHNVASQEVTVDVLP